MKDPIVEEIHACRRKRSAAFKHNLDAMAADLKRREAEAKAQGAKFVSPRKRRKSKIS